VMHYRNRKAFRFQSNWSRQAGLLAKLFKVGDDIGSLVVSQAQIRHGRFGFHRGR
jgi:hypothetical protein